jgi:hypothetical protein
MKHKTATNIIIINLYLSCKLIGQGSVSVSRQEKRKTSAPKCRALFIYAVPDNFKSVGFDEDGGRI